MDNVGFVWTVPDDHPAFAGHFPGQPIVPGVVLLDQIMYLAQHSLGRNVNTWQVGQAKFLSPVGPGEVLHFGMQPGARGGWAFRVETSSGVDVAAGTLVAL